MAMILDVNNLLDAAIASNMPAAAEHTAALEIATSALADALAEHLNVIHRKSDYQAGAGGLCATFYARSDEQECPVVLRAGDQGGDFNTLQEKRS